MNKHGELEINMRVEDVMGIHLLFMMFLTVVHLCTGEPQWTAITLLLSTGIIYGVYIPTMIIIVLVKAIKKNVKLK